MSLGSAAAPWMTMCSIDAYMCHRGHLGWSKRPYDTDKRQYGTSTPWADAATSLAGDYKFSVRVKPAARNAQPERQRERER